MNSLQIHHIRTRSRHNTGHNSCRICCLVDQQLCQSTRTGSDADMTGQLAGIRNHDDTGRHRHRPAILMDSLLSFFCSRHNTHNWITFAVTSRRRCCSLASNLGKMGVRTMERGGGTERRKRRRDRGFGWTGLTQRLFLLHMEFICLFFLCVLSFLFLVLALNAAWLQLAIKTNAGLRFHEGIHFLQGQAKVDDVNNFDK